MQCDMEFHCDLHGRYDSEPEWRELRRQLVDARSKSRNQQWWGWLWPTLDRDGYLFKFKLCGRAQYSNWVDSLWHDGFRHQFELDGGYTSCCLHCQLFHLGWAFDLNLDHRVRYCERPDSFDQLYLHCRSE